MPPVGFVALKTHQHWIMSSYRALDSLGEGGDGTHGPPASVPVVELKVVDKCCVCRPEWVQVYIHIALCNYESVCSSNQTVKVLQVHGLASFKNSGDFVLFLISCTLTLQPGCSPLASTYTAAHAVIVSTFTCHPISIIPLTSLVKSKQASLTNVNLLRVTPCTITCGFVYFSNGLCPRLHVSYLTAP